MTTPDEMDGAEIERVVAGLTKAQIAWLLRRPESGSWTNYLPSSERREFRGLIRRAGYDANEWTWRGRKVRVHLARTGHPVAGGGAKHGGDTQ